MRRTKVAWSALWAAENALYDRHPELEAAAPRWNLIEQNLRDCGRLQVGTWPDSCGSVVWQDYVLYRHSGLEEAFSVTVLAYQWALGQGIDKAWLDGFVTELVQGEGEVVPGPGAPDGAVGSPAAGQPDPPAKPKPVIGSIHTIMYDL